MLTTIDSRLRRMHYFYGRCVQRHGRILGQMGTTMGKGIHRPEMYCALLAFGVMDLMEAIFTKKKRRIRFMSLRAYEPTHNLANLGRTSEIQRPVPQKTAQKAAQKTSQKTSMQPTLQTAVQKISPPNSETFCASCAASLTQTGLPFQTDGQRLSSIVAQVSETQDLQGHDQQGHNRLNRHPNWRERFRRDWQ
jgi:hypothetical protein